MAARSSLRSGTCLDPSNNSENRNCDQHRYQARSSTCPEGVAEERCGSRDLWSEGDPSPFHALSPPPRQGGTGYAGGDPGEDDIP